MVPLGGGKGRLADYLAGPTGIEIVNYRISPWGPGGNPMSPFTAVPQLVHAAARGIAPDFSALRSPAHADDGFDMCYVKDCARAIDQAPATAVTPSLLPRKA